MARQLRIEFEGAFYHVYSRGERKEDIFFNHRDKTKFLDKIKESIDKFNLRIHCYALMNNHYHLLIETPDGNLSRSMHHINTSYANWLKAKYKIIGSVFHSRYKAILVEKEAYLLTLSAYIHLNPVRAGIVTLPEKFEWTSFDSYIKKNMKVSWVYTVDILNLFRQNREEYRNFVYSRMSESNQINQNKIHPKYSILGSEEFIERMLTKVKGEIRKNDSRERPDLRRLNKITSEQIKAAVLETFQIDETEIFSNSRNNLYQKIYFYGLKKYSDMTLKEIGNIFGIDYVAVSMQVKRFIEKSRSSNRLKRMIDDFESTINNFKC